MIKISLKDFNSYSGRFHHTHCKKSGMKLYLIGGGARGLLLSFLTGTQAPKPNDFDWTVIGEGDYSDIIWDRNPKKQNRIEIESEAPHSDLKSYFKSRDFAINQVAVDSKGNLYATKKALESFKRKILYLAEGRKEELTPREAVRACRFCMEYNLKMSPSLLKEVKKHKNSMVHEDVYHRYIQQGWDLEAYRRNL
jgi:hypothetical protein